MRKIAISLLAVLLLVTLAGCGSASTDGVSVQSVAMLAGLDAAGQVNRYGGVVTAGKQTDIKREEGKELAQVLVKVGDEVTKGQTLLRYNTAADQLNLEKAQLQLQQMQLDIEGQLSQKTQLENEKAAAGAEEQLSYTLEIQSLETAIREARYNVTLQQKEIDRLNTAVGNNTVTAPVDGKVMAINVDGSMDSAGNAKPLVSLVEAGGYQIKGTIDETNRTDLTQDMPVLIRSRTDEGKIWRGTIARIDWENPISSSSDSGAVYYGSKDSASETTTSSKYPFYVTVTSDSDLMLGQHVYIEADWGQAQENGLRLPAAFFNDAETDAPWVWAENGSKLEKRSVMLSDYDQELDTWAVQSGLTAQDYIAYPDETLRAGAATTHFDEAGMEQQTPNAAGNVKDTDVLEKTVTAEGAA
jgi:HlyD family secretion protein